jgi:hypothetical protein
MSDSDSILQGFLIAGFSLIGLSAISFCIRKKRTQMVKSASMEELSSVSTEDPQS